MIKFKFLPFPLLSMRYFFLFLIHFTSLARSECQDVTIDIMSTSFKAGTVESLLTRSNNVKLAGLNFRNTTKLALITPITLANSYSRFISANRCFNPHDYDHLEFKYNFVRMLSTDSIRAFKVSVEVMNYDCTRVDEQVEIGRVSSFSTNLSGFEHTFKIKQLSLRGIKSRRWNLRLGRITLSHFFPLKVEFRIRSIRLVCIEFQSDASITEIIPDDNHFTRKSIGFDDNFTRKSIGFEPLNGDLVQEDQVLKQPGTIQEDKPMREKNLYPIKSKRYIFILTILRKL